MHLYDLIDPAVLTGVARDLLADEDQAQNDLIMERWFPANLVDDVDFTYAKGTTRTFTNAMPFRAWNTEATIGTRPGRSRVFGQMPPLSMKLALTEYDRIKQRANNDSILAEAIEGDVFNDMESLIRSLRSRMAGAMSQAIVQGQIVLAENGLAITVDFNRAANHSNTVTNPWSDATLGKPLDDEIAVLEFMVDNEYLQPADLVVLMNRTTINSLIKSDQYRNAAPTLRVQERLSLAALNEVRTAHEMPAIVEYNARTASVDGTVAKQIPDDTAVWLPRNLSIGETQYGVPAMATEPGVELSIDQRPGPVGYLMRSLDPLTVWSVLDAIGIPLLRDPNATYVLDVS